MAAARKTSRPAFEADVQALEAAEFGAPAVPAPGLLAEAAHAATEASVHPETTEVEPTAEGTMASDPEPATVLAAVSSSTVAPAQATVATRPVATSPSAAAAAMETTMKTAEEFVSFGQGNIEAMMRAGQIWVSGVQDLSKNMAATAQSQLDQTVSTWKAMASVKSIKEALDLHSTLARSSLEVAVAETSKLTDASMKLAGDSFAPITERVTLAVGKFGRTA